VNDVSGRINRIRILANRATTPPSLFGIDRRMAYTHKKYHSGLMCTGVTSGFAKRKFSGSVKRFGRKRIISMKNKSAIVYPKKSFEV
jgi:hypothetical protein